jgi:hypothetical protein
MTAGNGHTDRICIRMCWRGAAGTLAKCAVAGLALQSQLCAQSWWKGEQ